MLNTKYTGALRLGTSSATHLYINPPIPEMKLLMDRYHKECTLIKYITF